MCAVNILEPYSPLRGVGALGGFLFFRAFRAYVRLSSLMHSARNRVTEGKHVETFLWESWMVLINVHSHWKPTAIPVHQQLSANAIVIKNTVATVEALRN